MPSTDPKRVATNEKQRARYHRRAGRRAPPKRKYHTRRECERVRFVHGVVVVRFD
jgi:hypothetical protein